MTVYPATSQDRGPCQACRRHEAGGHGAKVGTVIPHRVAVVQIDNQTMRFCPECLSHLQTMLRNVANAIRS